MIFIEALLYKKLEGNIVRCDICRHHCIIKEGNSGICKTKENRHGTLYSINYGVCVANSIDPIEKKPLYDYMKGSKTYSFCSVGCNMDCSWCQNHTISQYLQHHDYPLGESVLPLEHVNLAIKYGCPSISYTYTEPTIFMEYALETMKLAHKFNLKNIWVTNGYMSESSLRIILPLLDAVNIDLKGNNEVYKKYCMGDKRQVVDNIKRMIEYGIHVEITTLIIPTINDTIEAIEELSQVVKTIAPLSIPWHITRFFPTYKMKDKPITSKKLMITLYNKLQELGFTNIYLGNM